MRHLKHSSVTHPVDRVIRVCTRTDNFSYAFNKSSKFQNRFLSVQQQKLKPYGQEVPHEYLT